MVKHILEKNLLIEELNRFIEDAFSERDDMESMIRSLRGAALVMTEAHQQECSDKDKEIALLTSQLTAEASTILELKKRINLGENQLTKASTRATVAFVVVNRLSELNSDYLDAPRHMDMQLVESEVLEEDCNSLRKKLTEEQKCANASRVELGENDETNILKTEEKLTEIKHGVSAVRSCMKGYTEGIGTFARYDPGGKPACPLICDETEIWTYNKQRGVSNHVNLCA